MASPTCWPSPLTMSSTSAWATRTSSPTSGSSTRLLRRKGRHTKYTEFRGDPELRQEISKFYKEEYNMDVADEEIFVCTSACEGMYLVMESILDDGDEVIVQAPYFTPYPQQIELARGIPVELPTYEEEDFQIDVDRLESLITERTKALLINSPSNPTGNCLSVETMQKIAAIAEKYDLIVVADDIYTAFSYQSPFVALCLPAPA